MVLPRALDTLFLIFFSFEKLHCTLGLAKKGHKQKFTKAHYQLEDFS